jgi:hypothetical protein
LSIAARDATLARQSTRYGADPAKPELLGVSTMMKRTLVGVALGGWLMASGAVQAHHSLSGVYDIKKEGEISGVLTKVAFTNPHGAMHLAVKNPDGTTTDWVLTTGSANTLAGLGVSKNGPNAVNVGDEVTIKYFAARNGAPLGFIRTITLADKRTIQLSNGNSSE